MRELYYAYIYHPDSRMKSSLSAWQQGQTHDKHIYEDRENPWSKEEVQKTLEQFDKTLADLEGERILEVGSGLGIIHSIDIDCDSFGIDPLNMHNSEKLTNSHAEVMAGIGEQLPFETNSIDTVLSYNVLDHCIDPKAVINEAARVTRQNGRLLLEVNTYEVPNVVRNEIVGRLDTEHPHHFSKNEIRKLVTSAGYEITNATLLNRFALLKNPTLRRIGALPFRLRRFFITAEKQ